MAVALHRVRSKHIAVQLPTVGKNARAGGARFG